MIRSIFTAALLAALAFVAPAFARDEPRVVVGLYDGDLGSSSLKAAEPALNHLGLVLEAHSTAEKLPALAGREDVRGVLIWLDSGMLADAAGFTPWLRSATAANLPVALMGATPLAEDRFGMFLSLGLVYARDDRPYTYDLRSVEKDTDIVEFERRYDNLFPHVDLVRPLDPGLSQPLMILQRRGDVTDRTVPLAITPRGAYAAPGYALWFSQSGAVRQWYVDPVKWFRRAFRLGAVPVADPTTINGRRILAPALVPARPDDATAAAALLQEAGRSYPAVAIGDAAPTSFGVSVPRGGKGCDDHARTYLLGFDGAMTALDRQDAPYRTARFAPVVSVCDGETALASLGIQAALTHAAESPLIPVSPAALANLDAGAASARLEIVGDKSWRVHDRGGVETLRIDEIGALHVDWQKSEGVIGAGRVGDAVYVSLDATVDAPLLVLSDAPWVPPRVAVLVDSRWRVSSMERDWSQLTADIQGFGAGDMTWSVPPNSQWDIRLTTGNRELHRYAATADAQGRLAFSLPPLAAAGGTLEMLREDISGPGP